MNSQSWLLIALFTCHWLADYTYLSTIWMLKAKEFGRPLFPIFCHAVVQGFLMSFALYFFMERNSVLFISLISFQILSHFIIDVGKGRITYSYPITRDKMKYPYWILMGFDQLLHAIVIIIMAYIATK